MSLDTLNRHLTTLDHKTTTESMRWRANKHVNFTLKWIQNRKSLVESEKLIFFCPRDDSIQRWHDSFNDANDFLHFTVLKNAFNSFDREKSGSISTETVEEILRLMGQPFNKKTLEDMIEEVDEDKSGRLEFEEFIILAAKFIVEEDEEAREWLICIEHAKRTHQETHWLLLLRSHFSPEGAEGSLQIVRQGGKRLHPNIVP